MNTRLELIALQGLPWIVPGDDLASLIATALTLRGLLRPKDMDLFR